MRAEKEPEKITYYSTVDWWLALIVFGAVASVLVAGFRELQNGGNEAWILIGSAAFMILVVVGICFPCKYILTNRRLIIRSGLAEFGNEIELKTIQDVSLSFNPLAAPAWSLKRIKIKFEGGPLGFTLISPKDRKGFIEELNRRRDRLREEKPRK